jgi:uncharacterized DUF497 family protein
VVEYTWDPDKAIENELEHGVSFDEAETAANRALSRTVPDLEHSSLEDRFRAIGWSDLGRLLVVVTSEGEGLPRIISAWRATKRERDARERR